MSISSPRRSLRAGRRSSRVEEAHACSLDRRDDDGGAPVAIFHSTEARCSCTSGCGERFSKGSTSCAGRRKHCARAAMAPVSSQAARSVSCRAFGGLVVGDDDDDRGLRGLGEERDAQGAGGGGQSGDTPAPSREAEMPSHTFEAVGVLYAREGVANKGKDHAALILVPV